MEITERISFYIKGEKQSGQYIIVQKGKIQPTEKQLTELVGKTNILKTDLLKKINKIDIGSFDYAICKINPSPYPASVEPIIELVSNDQIKIII